MKPPPLFARRPTPLANYVPYWWAGNLLLLSGRGPKRPDGTFEIGGLGKNATVEDGYRAARLTGLQLLAVAESAVGDLSRIEAVVKPLGMVNAEADFGDHPSRRDAVRRPGLDFLGS
jgi:enamine deaminase RidA (YjgF/YER057c/UK114 family)